MKYGKIISIVFVLSFFLPNAVFAGGGTFTVSETNTKDTPTPSYYVSSTIIPDNIFNVPPLAFTLPQPLYTNYVENVGAVENFIGANFPPGYGSFHFDLNPGPFTLRSAVDALSVQETIVAPDDLPPDDEWQRGETGAQISREVAQINAQAATSQSDFNPPAGFIPQGEDLAIVRMGNTIKGAFIALIESGNSAAIGPTLNIELGNILSGVFNQPIIGTAGAGILEQIGSGSATPAGDSLRVLMQNTPELNAGENSILAANEITPLIDRLNVVKASMNTTGNLLSEAYVAIREGNKSKAETEILASSVGSLLTQSEVNRNEALKAESAAWNTYFNTLTNGVSNGVTNKGVALAYNTYAQATQAARDAQLQFYEASLLLGQISPTTDTFYGVYPPQTFGGRAINPDVINQSVVDSFQQARDQINADKAFLQAQCGGRCKAETRVITLAANASSVQADRNTGFVQGNIVKPFINAVGGVEAFEGYKSLGSVIEFGAQGTLTNSATLSDPINTALSIANEVTLYETETNPIIVERWRGIIDAQIKASQNDPVFAQLRQEESDAKLRMEQVRACDSCSQAERKAAFSAYNAAHAAAAEAAEKIPSVMQEIQKTFNVLSPGAGSVFANEQIITNANDTAFAGRASGDVAVYISNVFVPADKPAEGEEIAFLFSSMQHEPISYASYGGGLAIPSVINPFYEASPRVENAASLDGGPLGKSLQCLNVCTGQEGITTKPDNSYFVGPQSCSSSSYGVCNDVIFYTGWLCNPGFIKNLEGTGCLSLVQILEPPKLPEVTLIADPGQVLRGGNTTLSWTIANVSSCTAGDGWSGTKNSPSGSEIISNLIQSTTFTLTCTNAVGTATATATVYVPNPDFTLSSVDNLSIRRTKDVRSNSTTVTVKVDPTDGFGSDVILSAELSPFRSGFNYTFGDGTLSEIEYFNGSSFQISLPTADIQEGYVVTVTGVSGPLTRTLDLPVSVLLDQPKFEEF